MEYINAKLLATAKYESDWPITDLPEIVFVGRSNAGKSSLINALVNRKNLAYSGKTPGKTRLLNFFQINDEMVFADAPGYGYAKGNKTTVDDFSALMDPYLSRRDNLKGIVIILDIRRVPNDDDITMVEYVKSIHLPIIVACTKIDKVSNNQMHSNLFKISKALNIPKDALCPVSSLTKKGMEEMWNKLRDLKKETV